MFFPASESEASENDSSPIKRYIQPAALASQLNYSIQNEDVYHSGNQQANYKQCTGGANKARQKYIGNFRRDICFFKGNSSFIGRIERDC